MSSEEKRLLEAGFEKENLPIGVMYEKRCISDDSDTEIIVTVYKYNKKWVKMTGRCTPWAVAVSVGNEICFERGKTLDEAMKKAKVKVTSWIAALVGILKKAELIKDLLIDFSDFKV